MLARSAQVLRAYLLHGVTTVRNMAAGVWHTVDELATALAEPFA